MQPIKSIPSSRIEIEARLARSIELQPGPWYVEQIVYLAGLCDRVNKAMDPKTVALAEVAPYWLVHAMATRLAKETCDNAHDGMTCADQGYGLCVTEWCAVCAAKVWKTRELRQL